MCSKKIWKREGARIIRYQTELIDTYYTSFRCTNLRRKKKKKTRVKYIGRLFLSSRRQNRRKITRTKLLFSSRLSRFLAVLRCNNAPIIHFSPFIFSRWQCEEISRRNDKEIVRIKRIFVKKKKKIKSLRRFNNRVASVCL